MTVPMWDTQNWCARFFKMRQNRLVNVLQLVTLDRSLSFSCRICPNSEHMVVIRQERFSSAALRTRQTYNTLIWFLREVFGYSLDPKSVWRQPFCRCVMFYLMQGALWIRSRAGAQCKKVCGVKIASLGSPSYWNDLPIVMHSARFSTDDSVKLDLIKAADPQQRTVPTQRFERHVEQQVRGQQSF